MSSELRFIISGGGTGGHIFPALAIAEALRLTNAGVDILFVGSKGKMEMEKVPSAGYPIKGLWISGLQRKLSLRNVLFPLKVLLSSVRAWQIIREFKPDAVIGTGGYASGPTLRMAGVAGIPTLIQEQNSYPGITNRLLSKKADRICVAFEGMEKYFPAEKIRLTGNPVRQDITRLESKRSEAFDFFNLDPGKLTLLVMGGSLGARAINECMKKDLQSIVNHDIQIIWQTGSFYFDEMNDAIKGYDKANISVHAFITRMDLAYAAADAVISRAGAIAISELCVAGKPSILIPSPNVAEDHQTKNAQALAEKGAAILLPEKEANDKLLKLVVNLFTDPSQRRQLHNAISRMAHAEAAASIVKEIMQLIENKKK